MTGPFLVLYLLFFLAPFVYSIALSLRSPLTNGFVGLFNYRNVVGNGQFWSAVVRMVYFGVIQVTVMIALAVGLALLLGDSGSGISMVLDPARFLFINVDLTIVLPRDPEGDWLLLDSATTIGGGCPAFA